MTASNPSPVIAKTASLLSQGLKGMPPAVQSTPFAQGFKPETKKPRRRRRKPQKPGKTAKQNDRHFVVHNYHDHAQDISENDLQEIPSFLGREVSSLSFPTKLHAILDQVEEDGLSHVISWQPHGRCFVIHKPKDFTDHVMPKYFRQTKITSFQRQLNLYGFSRLTIGKDNGGYYHELFLKGKVFLANKMSRTKIKGTKYKAAGSPDQEPDFYSMEPVTFAVTPPTSDESSVDDGSYGSHNYPAAMPQSTRIPQVTLPKNMVMSAQTPSLLTVNPYMKYPQLVQGSLPQMQVPSLMHDVLFTNWETMPTVPSCNADNAFDAAINEIFEEPTQDNVNMAEGFSNMWDPNIEIPGSIDDDQQLGNILEQLMSQV